VADENTSLITLTTVLNYATTDPNTFLHKFHQYRSFRCETTQRKCKCHIKYSIRPQTHCILLQQ